MGSVKDCSELIRYTFIWTPNEGNTADRYAPADFFVVLQMEKGITARDDG